MKEWLAIENEVVITKNGTSKKIVLPDYGTITIKVVGGKPERVETTTQEKI